MINIPSDLRKNKDTIISNMDLRESICLLLGLLLAIFILYYIRVALGYKRIVIASFVAGIFVIPFLLIGFKKINGMRIEDYFKVYVNNRIIANSNRMNICPYTEKQVKSTKYELIRYYKLNDICELLTLRQYLIDKNILILTEYIDYKGDKIVVFRLDGRELILAKIRRNKVEIEKKIKEIKDFIKNEINPIKALKKHDAEDKLEFIESKKIKLHCLNNRLKELKLEMKYLQSKTFNDLKDEVNIFEGIEHIKSERIWAKEQSKNKNEETKGDYISGFKKLLSGDERAINQLHLFNKESFRSIVENMKDKIVFINAENKVDVFYYAATKETDVEIVDENKIVGENESISANKDVGVNKNAGKSPILDYIELDRKSGLYEGSILSLKAINLYNHYRSVKSLEEML